MCYGVASYLEYPTQEFIGVIEDAPIVVKIRDYSLMNSRGYHVLVDCGDIWYMFKLYADATCKGDIPDKIAEFIEKETGYYCMTPKGAKT